MATNPQKCEACGQLGTEYVGVHVVKGRLNLCRQCLTEINVKNPEVKRLRAELAA